MRGTGAPSRLIEGRGLRRTVRLAHLWLGLSVGALFVLLGLTGSALVFYPEIDALLNPEIAAGSDTPPDWDAALRTVRAAYPDKAGPWRFEVTDAPGAIPARYYDPAETAGRDFAPMMVWLSQDGSRILRRDYWGEYAVTFVYDLHYRLLLGESAGEVVGWLGFAMLALLASGLWAWWPMGSWAKALRFRLRGHPQRALRDWHKGAGLMGLGLLILLTSTGIMLELPAQTDSAWDAAGLTVADPAAPVAPPTPAGSQPIAPSRAIATALAALPGARLAWIETPGAARATYRFRMQVAGDPSYRFPHSYVHIDASNGAVVHIVDARRASPGRSITNWLHTVHAEAGLGLPGRIVTFLAGLLPFVLFVTGYLRWKKRAGTRSCGKKGHTSGNS